MVKPCVHIKYMGLIADLLHMFRPKIPVLSLSCEQCILRIHLSAMDAMDFTRCYLYGTKTKVMTAILWKAIN